MRRGGRRRSASAGVPAPWSFPWSGRPAVRTGLDRPALAGDTARWPRCARRQGLCPALRLHTRPYDQNHLRDDHGPIIGEPAARGKCARLLTLEVARIRWGDRGAAVLLAFHGTHPRTRADVEIRQAVRVPRGLPFDLMIVEMALVTRP